MSVVAGVLAFLVAIFVIVLVHELGHLLAAKRAGMEASVFSVGFGPPVWRRTWGGTEYRLSAIPLGGYVRIDAMEQTVEGPHGATSRFDTYPLGARLRVIVAGVVMNLLLALGLYMAIPLTWGVPVEEPLRLAGLVAGAVPEGAEGWRDVPADARILALGERRIESARELYMAVAGARPGRSELLLEGGRRVPVTIPAGDDPKLALVNALVTGHPPVVGAVASGSPAAAAGLRPGDRFVAVAGRPVTTWQGWRRAVAAVGSGPVSLEVLRRGEVRTLRLEDAAGGDTRALGLVRGVDRARPGLAGALSHAGHSFVGTVDLIRESWAILVTGRLSPRQLSGPVTIVDATVRIFRSGWEPFLSFVAFLSINIALVNALPIPALDGGYLALLGLEAVRRRPVPQPVQAYLGRVGMIWLSLIMAGTLVNDVLRLAGH